jgi:subtilisin-like proprotein convertase family protein
MRTRCFTLIACCFLFIPVGDLHAQKIPPVEARTQFDIEDGGRKRRFEIATDEFSEKSSAGDEKAAKSAKKANNLGELRQMARDAEAATGNKQDIVLYEAGKARNETTRRVLTRQVLVKFAPGFDAKAAKAAIGAVTSNKPGYAPEHVIFTLRGAGDSLLVLDTLRALPGVDSAEPLLARMQKRRLLPNDTFFSYNAANPGYQWHLRNTGQSPGVTGVDVNVTTVWDSYLGTGIRMGIVDDGLEVAHADLSPNADTVNDHDWNDATPDDPTGNPSSDTHGTACAGVAGARGNNSGGVSGAAPQATLVGLRLIAGNVSDAQEAEALTWKNDIIQIYSNSWGPADDGADLRDAGSLVKAAFANGATVGRGGKGSIWLWAGGNGGSAQDNSNYDGYANSIYTIAIGALNDSGARSAYSEPGANVLVCAPSNDSASGHRGITTTTTNGNYTHSFGGTSSATPLAAGVVALLLQSKPSLGWRDVKEILLRSATKINPTHVDWVNNSAGYHFNHEYGAGLINAQAAVTLANTWTNLGPMVTQTQAQNGLTVAIPDGNATGTTRTFTIPGSVLMRVEHATVKVTATHGLRGNLNVTLTSPAGTVSKLFNAHTNDGNLNLDWTFSTVRHWGEGAAGNWSVKVSDTVSGNAGTLTSAALTLYGTNITPPTAQPTITSPLAASANAESPFSYQIAASQNPQLFSASGLPSGLSLSASGLISGIPVTQGVSNITIGATNSLGTGTASLVLTVGPRLPTPPVITSSLAAAAVVNVPFNYQISSTNAPTGYSASSLPAGVTVNTQTGAINGTPTVIGTFNASITATNVDGTDTDTLVITVSATASALAQALDAPQLIFTSGGNVPWITPATDTHDGVDAAQNGDISDSQQSWMETTVTGPAFISFWFRLSSESNYDFFRFSINGEELWFSDGEHAWRRLGFHVPAGIHTARWNYTKDFADSSGSDTLWLDQVAVDGEQAFLSTVLDNANLSWRMPGLGTWIMQDRRTIDAVDALISPIYLADGRSSSIETPVMGPGTVSFAWTVASELNSDYFRFEIDGTVSDQISGNSSGNNIAWTTLTRNIPAGPHILRWRYIKDGQGEAGLDAAWLDNIQYTTAFATGPPYAQWLNGHFPVNLQGNATHTGPEIDYDGDGRSNLDEYAFGGSPLVPDTVPNPVSIQPQPSEMFFEYSREVSKTDLILTPRVSENLANWADTTAEFVALVSGRNHYRVRVPLTEGRKFIHLRATLQQ